MKHPGSLTLRRLQAGEAVGGEVSEHVTSCDVCQAELARFTQEQQAFEQAISFDRFAAGVERAARQQTKPAPRRQWPQVVLALAASVTLIAGVQLVLSRVEPAGGGNRLKGGASIQMEVAGAGPQREPFLPAAAGNREEKMAVRLFGRRKMRTYRHIVTPDAAPPHPQPSETIKVNASKSAGARALPPRLATTGRGP